MICIYMLKHNNKPANISGGGCWKTLGEHLKNVANQFPTHSTNIGGPKTTQDAIQVREG